MPGTRFDSLNRGRFPGSGHDVSTIRATASPLFVGEEATTLNVEITRQRLQAWEEKGGAFGPGLC